VQDHAVAAERELFTDLRDAARRAVGRRGLEPLGGDQLRDLLEHGHRRALKSSWVIDSGVGIAAGISDGGSPAGGSIRRSGNKGVRPREFRAGGNGGVCPLCFRAARRCDALLA
jgi:hypothetical protein